jgi:hypothetical protein
VRCASTFPGSFLEAFVRLDQGTLVRTREQAFTALTPSTGARRYYDRHRSRGKTHHEALRALANRLSGILHGRLTSPSR